jgi:ABC-type sugar transport system substrate-binding protein
VDAIDAAGRKDVIVYATGNNKVSLDLMKAGKVHGIRWESAEADGALALETAVDYFNGLDVHADPLPADERSSGPRKSKRTTTLRSGRAKFSKLTQKAVRRPPNRFCI